ncbi:MAG TPA: ABC transporter permease [Polyangiaceae bacterium]|nr:ABC transporter permease [Polyangiaceae bacterium]
MVNLAVARAAEPRARPPSTIAILRLARPQRRALVSYFAALLVWQLGSTSGRWLGFELPLLGRVPAPSDVLLAWSHLILDPGYWQSWIASWKRVAVGFSAAVLTGVPLGLIMALNRPIWDVVFPVFELLRPIPPLAWVPVAIIFWPTQELSIDAVIFIGAFYTLVLNAVSGARSVDPRLIEVARSMGASKRNILTRLVLPGVLPSVLVGMEVSIGITWEVVVAAEMISGGGSSRAASSGGGLGFFIWNSYVGGSYPQIIVGMISIGIAGYLSSAALRAVAARLSRWNAPHGGRT